MNPSDINGLSVSRFRKYLSFLNFETTQSVSKYEKITVFWLFLAFSVTFSGLWFSGFVTVSNALVT